MRTYSLWILRKIFLKEISLIVVIRLKLNYLYFYSQKFRDYAVGQIVAGSKICITQRELKFVFLDESFAISRSLMNYLTIAVVIAVSV